VNNLQKNLFVILAITFCFLFLCTIKDDNGNLALTGPTQQQQPTNQNIKPFIIIVPDSEYVGLKETLSISITVMKDSTLREILPNTKIICFTSHGFISADTLITDSRGMATIKIMDTIKTQITVTVICLNQSRSVQISVTNAPEKIQKRIQIMPEKSVLKADGKDYTTIQVFLMNEYNNPIVGQCIQFISTSGIIVGEGGCDNSGQSITNENGIAKATLTSANINDTAFITAFLVSDKSKTAQTQVVFKGVNIIISADSTNLRIGQEALVVAQLLNGSNLPIAFSPIFFSFGKDTASVLSIISKDTVTDAEGYARCIVKSRGNLTGTDSLRISSAGATSSLRMNVTNLFLKIELDDNVLQARETRSTTLHVTFADKSGTPLTNKEIQLKRSYQKIDKKDTSDISFYKTNQEGKCDIVIYALPYESKMSLEVTAFNTATDIASAKTTISFITSRTITINAIPTVIQADGTSSSTITVQVKNEDFNPIVGDQVKFFTTAGIITEIAETDKDGKAIATLTSDRRNTIATVKAVLLKDPTKTASIQVEFSGVEITANANPPSINSSGKDTSTISITLIDAGKNPIVGERINFSKQKDSTKIVFADTATNNRGEAHCKIVGTASGIDTIKIEAAGASTKVALNYSSNYVLIDTIPGQSCVANGKDSTGIKVTYLHGDKITPIDSATIDISVTLGNLNNDTVFSKRFELKPSNNGVLYFYIKNPDFANTATIFVYAKTSKEITTGSFKLYFKAARVKKIVLSGTPEVIAANGSRAKIIAVAFDSLGNRVKDERISFNMISGPGGGEYIDPPTVITAEDGSAITYLVSGKTPSLFREVWVTASDLFGLKSDTVKFTIAGPPHSITIRQNLKEGEDYHDGTFGLPVAAIVTDINGNPVANGTEVTFSLKITGWVVHRPVAFFNTIAGVYCYTVTIDTMYTIYPFEDLNDNFKCDPDEDINGDGIASRGEDIDGDGKLTLGPPYIDINRNGKRDYLPVDIVEPYRTCGSWTDSSGVVHRDTVFADFNGNGKLDTYEPLLVNMPDTTYTYLLNEYKKAHKGMPYDIDIPNNGVADPNTAIAISRTQQTVDGKATNKITYGQADANFIEVTIWAESQGVRTQSPAKFILPFVGGVTK